MVLGISWYLLVALGISPAALETVLVKRMFSSHEVLSFAHPPARKVTLHILRLLCNSSGTRNLKDVTQKDGKVSQSAVSLSPCKVLESHPREGGAGEEKHGPDTAKA